MRSRRKKNLFIFLMGIFAFLGIGYAFLSSNLNINGTAKIMDASWDIHFANLVVQEGSVPILDGDSAASITNPTTITFSISMKQPRDYYEFVVDVVNSGSLPGVISSVELSGISPAVEKLFGYHIKYVGGTDVEEGDLLDPNSSKTIDVKLYYKEDIDITDLPDSLISQTFTVTVVYEQGDRIEKRLCTYDGELVQGAEFVDGQYTYRYMQQRKYSGWENITDDGWGLSLTNSNSTAPINTQMCGSINGNPIVSGKYAFANSKFTSIDLSKLYTKDMKNMMWMFGGTSLTSFDTSLLNTSNATNMWGMFANNNFTEIELSNLDTSKVTDMTFMFGNFVTDSLEISTWNTSNVQTVEQMFFGAHIGDLSISNFGGNNLTTMKEMFYQFEGNVTFDNLNTSNVTNLNLLFYESVIDHLDLTEFDTTNVTTMNTMFAKSTIYTVDISSFYTPNLDNVTAMFNGNSNLTTIYASSNFIIDNITNDGPIMNSPNLVGGAGTNCSGTRRKEYLRIDNPPDAPGCFTQKP